MKKNVLKILFIFGTVSMLSACALPVLSAKDAKEEQTDEEIAVLEEKVIEDNEPKAETTASGEGTLASEDESERSYFYVEDDFTIIWEDENYSVIAGYFVGGTLNIYDTLVFEHDGESIETMIYSFETPKQEHPKSVEEYEHVAMWIDTYLKGDIQPGDKLYYKGDN